MPSDTENKPTSRRDFEAAIVAKAWKDPAYLERLRKHPKKVVQEELAALYPGAKLPPELRVSVHMEDEHRVHLVVPRHPQEVTGQELTDEVLDQAAGGTGVGVVVAVVTGGEVNQVVGPAVDIVLTVLINPVTVQVNVDPASLNLIVVGTTID